MLRSVYIYVGVFGSPLPCSPWLPPSGALDPGVLMEYLSKVKCRTGIIARKAQGNLYKQPLPSIQSFTTSTLYIAPQKVLKPESQTIAIWGLQLKVAAT